MIWFDSNLIGDLLCYHINHNDSNYKDFTIYSNDNSNIIHKTMPLTYHPDQHVG